MVQHQMVLARSSGDQGNQGPQHIKTTSYRRRKGTQEHQDHEKQRTTYTQLGTTPAREAKPGNDTTGELQGGISTARRDSGTKNTGQPPRQEERTRERSGDPRNVSRGELV
ncbi:hypothetical protein HPB48_002309 [Haemaphysalis longicornis]|uniref:Uncharacterized protein n=1 Tax=Haemaphysalis longicornis TaxID=44386 RepID=A0A9J6GMQ8_HAELO|nr:hypothetical protein HPB48_002309 [Haemaphysalis longicornis]